MAIIEYAVMCIITLFTYRPALLWHSTNGMSASNVSHDHEHHIQRYVVDQAPKFDRFK